MPPLSQSILPWGLREGEETGWEGGTPPPGLRTQALGDVLSTEAGTGDTISVQLAATIPSALPPRDEPRDGLAWILVG